MFTKTMLKSLLICSTLILLPLLLSADQTDFCGEWDGCIFYANNDCNISLKISTDEDGNISAILNIPLQDISNYTADEVVFENDLIIIEFQSKGIVYKGEIKGNTIEGKWRQQGMSLDLNFEKVF